MYRILLPALFLPFLGLLRSSPAEEPLGLNLVLEDTTGQKHALGELKDAKAVVFFFTAVECPNANRYLTRMNDLHKTYADKGVKCFAVYSNALETVPEITKHSQDAAYRFPALLDANQKAADALQAKITPSVVLLDASGKVRYRGLIDDHKNEQLVKNRHLRAALDAVLGGKEVEVKSTEPVGCAIQRRVKENRDSPVTFADQVAPLLHKHCVSCHRPGQLAPFSLMTHEQARRWAESIKTYTESKAMPPWKPVNRGMFHGERGLSKEEIEVLAKWADAGAPLGDKAKVPAPPKFSNDWALGKPDLILAAEEYQVEAEGSDDYRCFILDPKLDEDKFVQAVEFRPGNARIVHHVMTYIDVFGFAKDRSGNDGKPGFPSRGTGPGFFPAGDLGGWGPGMQPVALPAGTARFLPKKAKIVMEVHYHKNGRREKDMTMIGLYFAKEPVKKRLRSQVVLDLAFRIPPGAKRHEVKAEWNVKEDLHAVAIIPHMHLIGREILVTATLPDGAKQTMVHIKDWDFNWQEWYTFQKPFALPAGAKVELTGWFDNSAENPNNPNNPPKLMRFGENTTDEMCVAYIAYTRDKEE